MGWLDKLAGRPQEPRKPSSRREERAAERAAMRASHSTTSPSGSWTQGHQRSSRQPSRRVSGTQPSPGTSPRGHEHGVPDKWRQALGLVGAHHPSHHQQQPQPANPQHHPSLSRHSQQSEHAHPQQQYQQQRPSMHDSGAYHAAAQAATHTQSQNNQQQAEQVRELQQRLHHMEAQVGEVESLKQRLLTEQRGVQEWRDKWNLQNFKLNLMVDMLVLQAVEQQPPAGSSRPAAGQLSPAVMGPGPIAAAAGAKAAGQPQSPMLMAGVGRGPVARRDNDLVAEDVDDY